MAGLEVGPGGGVAFAILVETAENLIAEILAACDGTEGRPGIFERVRQKMTMCFNACNENGNRSEKALISEFSPRPLFTFPATLLTLISLRKRPFRPRFLLKSAPV
jgi:hypothetical protein